MLESQGQAHQQAQSIARHSSHSHAAESKTGIISMLGIQQDTATTHPLESQRQTSLASLNIARYRSYSPSKTPKTGIISMLGMQQATATLTY